MGKKFRLEAHTERRRNPIPPTIGINKATIFSLTQLYHPDPITAYSTSITLLGFRYPTSIPRPIVIMAALPYSQGVFNSSDDVSVPSHIHTHAAKLPQALVIRPTDSQQISTTTDFTYTSQQRTSDKHANHTSGSYKITTGTLRGGAGLPGEDEEFDHDMPAGDDFYDSTEVSAEDQALPGGSPGSVSSGYSSSSDLSAAASEHFHEQNELQHARDNEPPAAGPSGHPSSAGFLGRPWHDGDYFSHSPRLGSPFQFEHAPLTGSRNPSRSHSMDILPYTGPPNDSTSSIQHTPYEGPSERRPLIGSHVPGGIPPPGYTYDGGEEDLPVAPQPPWHLSLRRNLETPYGDADGTERFRLSDLIAGAQASVQASVQD